ncbi:CCC motif membrane protein [Labilibaculum sp.]|uniref:CCC motif membrane protein n=1 Tax=Labilibaculum sp. TaxID=2060723 RepID=UPI002AA930D3|nr:CCC motif membrane protein [Labilibaculum sp.]MBN2596599.1 hypothetical protein [Marinifilaceae bacterium]
MENRNQTSTNKQEVLPNSSSILVLGILSIFLFCFAGIISLVMAIIALILSKQATKLYQETPHLYTSASWNNVTTGKTCAFIGLLLATISFLLFVIIILIGAGFALSFLSNFV